MLSFSELKKIAILISVILLVFLSIGYMLLHIVGLKEHTSNHYKIHATFTNVTGLSDRSVVKIAGVTVGKVSDIQLDKETYDAKVTLLIEPNYQIPETSRVAVYSNGILGEKFLHITPGFVDESLDLGYVKPEGTLQDTVSSVILEELLGNVVSSFLEKKEN